MEVSYKRGGWTKPQKFINVEYQIRPWRVEFDPKINKRGVHVYSIHKSTKGCQIFGEKTFGARTFGDFWSQTFGDLTIGEHKQ